MFKKSRRKIVAAIMSILVLLWVGTLGVIYASSYFEMTKQNEQEFIQNIKLTIEETLVLVHKNIMILENTFLPILFSRLSNIASIRFRISTFTYSEICLLNKYEL